METHHSTGGKDGNRLFNVCYCRAVKVHIVIFVYITPTYHVPLACLICNRGCSGSPAGVDGATYLGVS